MLCRYGIHNNSITLQCPLFCHWYVDLRSLVVPFGSHTYTVGQFESLRAVRKKLDIFDDP